jgi:hypothetical protein
MWAGSLQNLWYYADPHFGNATIREKLNTFNVVTQPNKRITSSVLFRQQLTDNLLREHRMLTGTARPVAVDNVF